MGKHERADVEHAEKNIALLLNNQSVGENFEDHELYRPVKILTEKIKSDFPNIKQASHVGNSYDSLGDLELVLHNGREVYLEVKFLAPTSGKGTRANIGQDSLTEFNLFDGEDILSWSAFRKTRAHTSWIRQLLNNYENYPEEIQNLKPTKSEVYAKAAHLKKVVGASVDTRKAAQEKVNRSDSSPQEITASRIILEIMDRDRQEKLEYLDYLGNQKQKPDNIKKFLFSILSGAHTQTMLRERWEVKLPEIINIIEDGYYVYYIDKDSLKVTRDEKCVSKLRGIVDEKLFLYFPKNQTNIMVSFQDNNGIENILRIVLHWKNKFQGIQTPCLNIFDEGYLTRT